MYKLDEETKAQMRGKLIGTLSFYLDETVSDNSSAEIQVGEKEFRIYIRPNTDKKLMAQLGLEITHKRIVSIMAHELGHFVAESTKENTHSPFFRSIFGPQEAEKRAWEIAEEITDIDPAVKKTALRSYDNV